MSKVEQGIEINNQHIYNVENDIEEQVSFIDRIKALGYNNLEEFFDEKIEYEMQKILHGKVYEVEPKDAMATFAKFLREDIYAIASIYTPETCVHKGQDPTKTINREYCLEHNVPIYEYDTFGGSIVVTPGDYTIILSVPIETDVSTGFFLKHFKKILDKYLDNVEIEGNDILYNGVKVAGTTVLGTNTSYSLSITFSMSPKAELISNICGEPITHKTPGYIDTSLLSTEQLMEELLSWLQGL